MDRDFASDLSLPQFIDFDAIDTQNLQTQLETSRYRQVLRTAYVLIEDKNRQLFLSEVKVQEYEQRMLKAERLLLQMGFKRLDDGEWVCQTPRNGPR